MSNTKVERGIDAIHIGSAVELKVDVSSSRQAEV